MNDPGFEMLLQSARERNWGFTDVVSVPRLKSAYEALNHQWEAWHYDSSTDSGIIESYFLESNTEGIMYYYDDLSGRKIQVITRVDSDELGFVVNVYMNGDWVPITTGDQGLTLPLYVYMDSGDYLETQVYIPPNNSIMLLEDDTQAEYKILHELSESGCCDMEIPLALADETGTYRDLCICFSLAELYSNFSAIFSEAERTGWTEPVEQASANGQALISLTKQTEKDVYELDWVKLHTSDGQLYIRNREAYPGVCTRADGRERGL